MAFDPKDYPATWPEMRAAALERAGHKCEVCGVKNHAVGARDRHGNWHDEDDIHHMNSSLGHALFDARFPRMIKIVLTCHHPDRDRDNPAARLEVLCQRCHLNADRAHHIAKRAETLRRRRLERQPELTGLTAAAAEDRA